MKGENKMKEEKEMTKLEELWWKSFPLRQGWGRISLQAADGRIVNLTCTYGDWILEITDPTTGKTIDRYADHRISYCHAKGDSVFCNIQKNEIIDGILFNGWVKMEIKVVL